MPTRWEKGEVVTEYPVEGGIRVMRRDGTVTEEWSPEGVLTLHGVKTVAVTDAMGKRVGFDGR